jgi:alkylation response protein AidB-like acyl-CoA dehydrogenase
LGTGRVPWPLIEKLAKLGVVGDGIDGYGCPSMSPIAAGLVHMELNRGDGSLGTFLGVQSGLAMRSIAMLGSQEQKRALAAGMARWRSWARSRSPNRCTVQTPSRWRPRRSARATRGSSTAQEVDR